MALAASTPDTRTSYTFLIGNSIGPRGTLCAQIQLSTARVTDLQHVSPIYCTCHRSTTRVTDLQHVSLIYCTCHRSTAHVTDLLHVSPIYSTCHRTTARVTELQHVSPTMFFSERRYKAFKRTCAQAELSKF